MGDFFSPYSPPYSPPYPPPIAPNKTIFSFETIEEDEGTGGYDIPEGVNYVDVKNNGWGQDIEIVVTFQKKREIPNTKYEKELEVYEKAKAKHLKLLEEWNIKKIQYEKEQEKKDKISRKVMYENLKKEFEENA